MKKKSGLLITSVVLIISIFIISLVVSKLRQNQVTTGTPVGAASIDKSFGETFPGFPSYPDSRLVASKKEQTAVGTDKYTATWLVGGDNVISEVTSWYITAISRDGWTKIQTRDGGLMKQEVKFIKKTQSLDLVISKGEGENPYAITVTATISSAKK